MLSELSGLGYPREAARTMGFFSWQLVVGIQNKSPQDAPLWYADCFKLKGTLASGLRETSAPLFSYLEELELEALPITDYAR